MSGALLAGGTGVGFQELAHGKPGDMGGPSRMLCFSVNNWHSGWHNCWVGALEVSKLVSCMELSYRGAWKAVEILVEVWVASWCWCSLSHLSPKPGSQGGQESILCAAQSKTGCLCHCEKWGGQGDRSSRILLLGRSVLMARLPAFLPSAWRQPLSGTFLWIAQSGTAGENGRLHA